VSSSPRSIAPGQARTLSVAGIPFRIAVEDGAGLAVALPRSYEPFSGGTGPNGLQVRVRRRESLPTSAGSLLYDSGLHWRALRDQGAFVFEMRHPPTSRTYCRATVNDDFTEAEIDISRTAWRALGSARSTDWEIPYPLDQLLMVPTLARRGVVVLHAGGAVLGERAVVFAGHSGDGKTTLTGLLENDGIELLSDERVAVRSTPEGFVAHGTPWPGEGNVVSSESRPLGGLFVLRKAATHALGTSSPRAVFPELLARAIVPYYLQKTASRILEILDELQGAFPPRELHFALAPGLPAFLRRTLSEGIHASA
jgi:hypothetical protein